MDVEKKEWVGRKERLKEEEKEEWTQKRMELEEEDGIRIGLGRRGWVWEEEERVGKWWVQSRLGFDL